MSTLKNSTLSRPPKNSYCYICSKANFCVISSSMIFVSNYKSKHFNHSNFSQQRSPVCPYLYIWIPILAITFSHSLLLLSISLSLPHMHKHAHTFTHYHTQTFRRQTWWSEGNQDFNLLQTKITYHRMGSLNKTENKIDQ